MDNGFKWNDAGIKVPAGEIDDIYDNLHYLEMVTLTLGLKRLAVIAICMVAVSGQPVRGFIQVMFGFLMLD